MFLDYSADPFFLAFLHKDTVNTIVEDMLQWPHRIVVPIGGIPVDTRWVYDLPIFLNSFSCDIRCNYFNFVWFSLFRYVIFCTSSHT